MGTLATVATGPVLGTVGGDIATYVERLFDGFIFYLR